MECIRGQVRWSGMHARTLVSECYSQLASISHEAHHSRARECQGEGNHQRAFRSFPQHKLREKCMQAEVCYHMRRGGRKASPPKALCTRRSAPPLRSRSVCGRLGPWRGATLFRRSLAPFCFVCPPPPLRLLVYVCVFGGGGIPHRWLTIIIPTQLSHTTARRRGERLAA